MHSNSNQLLSATQLGQKLGGLNPGQVRRLEREGKVFSIPHSNTSPRRNYPAFQAWPELSGETINRVISELGSISGEATYGFFVKHTDVLGGLAPIEVLCGKVLTPRQLESYIEPILSRPYAERIAAVERAARVYGKSAFEKACLNIRNH